ncbi:MAG: tetratricopeptide repeat protein [Chitinivibrionales bacterium]|nr:tetratricopeptide repeat protein [Chitinivibrionales bacterium]
MNRILLMLIAFSLSVATAAPVEQWMGRANAFYENKKYDSALVYLERILAEGVRNSAVYYNAGNAYYRRNKIGRAILYYEKAAQLAPRDKDIQANIKFARLNIIDRIPEPEQGFLVSLLWGMHSLFDLQTQLWLLLVLLFALALLFSGGLFSSRNLRLWIIYASVLLGLATLATGTSVGYKIYRAENVTYAIVLDTSVDALNQPNGNKVMFTAHEGTRFRILKSLDDWSFVSLPNGVSGWVEMRTLGII